MADVSSTPRRWPTLDALRLIAITMAMMTHFPSLGARLHFLAPYQENGTFGVDLFMLISGWLLGGQLLQEQLRTDSINTRRFYFKRWMRTLPPYFAMVLILWIADGANTRAWLIHFTFMQVYLGVNLYGVSWSLCVEEHFYLVLPWVVRVTKRLGFPALVAGVIGIEALSFASRTIWYHPTGGLPPTHMRMDGLWLGFLLAYVRINRPALWEKLGKPANWLALAGFIGSLVFMPLIKTEPQRLEYGSLGITWLFLLVFIACVHPKSWLSRIDFPGLRYLGELTYSMYLVHDVLPKRWLLWSVSQSPVLALANRIVLVAVLSVALHHLVERPFLRLRERWLPLIDGAVAPAAEAVAVKPESPG